MIFPRHLWFFSAVFSSIHRAGKTTASKAPKIEQYAAFLVYWHPNTENSGPMVSIHRVGMGIVSGKFYRISQKFPFKVLVALTLKLLSRSLLFQRYDGEHFDEYFDGNTQNESLRRRGFINLHCVIMYNKESCILFISWTRKLRRNEILLWGIMPPSLGR